MAVSTITITATRSGTPSTVVINRGPAGPAGDAGTGGGVDSYVDDIESLVDYPATFPPDAHTQATSTITGLDTALGLLAPLAGANTWTNTQTFDSIASVPGGSELTVGGGIFMDGGSTFAYATNTERAAHRAELGVFGTGDAGTFASVTTTGVLSGGGVTIEGDTTNYIRGGEAFGKLYIGANGTITTWGGAIYFGASTTLGAGIGPVMVGRRNGLFEIRASSTAGTLALEVDTNSGNLTASGTVTEGVFTVDTTPTHVLGASIRISSVTGATVGAAVTTGGGGMHVKATSDGSAWICTAIIIP